VTIRSNIHWLVTVTALAAAAGCAGSDSPGNDESAFSFDAAAYKGSGGNNGTAGAAGHVCGNGSVEPGEECDGVMLGGATCASVTMGSQSNGSLKCLATCLFDRSGCQGSGVAAGSGGSSSIGGGAGGGTTLGPGAGGGP
jgi:hypothetical protein